MSNGVTVLNNEQESCETNCNASMVGAIATASPAKGLQEGHMTGMEQSNISRPVLKRPAESDPEGQWLVARLTPLSRYTHAHIKVDFLVETSRTRITL